MLPLRMSPRDVDCAQDHALTMFGAVRMAHHMNSALAHTQDMCDVIDEAQLDNVDCWTLGSPPYCHRHDANSCVECV